MNLQLALSFPFKDSNWVLKLLIGGVLSLIGLLPMAFGILGVESVFFRLLTYVLFFGLFVLFLGPLGYGFSILKSAEEGQSPSLPEWKDWGVIFKNGLMVLGVCLAYGVIIWVLAWLVGILSTRIPVFGSILSLLQIVIGFLTLLIGPVIAIALCKLAQTGQIAASFKFMEVLSELKSKAAEYISVSLILIGIKEVVKTCLGLNLYQYMMAARVFWKPAAMTFPLVAWLTPFALFWILIVSFRMYGEIYGKK
ncbi:MAG: DUF4013 domain-containing protein [Chlamydiae bacterium]|nr:DUF4013 domain-containing protein [Chlamydiota bacterium]MBI3265502.1 DUF4013 domain-containing protein [Chlamydiota bacterium]